MSTRKKPPDLVDEETDLPDDLKSNLPDADMQAAPRALLRAAKRAREIARQTGTPIVYVRDGVLVEEMVTYEADGREKEEEPLRVGFESKLPDADMQAVPRALARAAKRAREIARQTGTPIVYVRDGVLVKEMVTDEDIGETGRS